MDGIQEINNTAMWIYFAIGSFSLLLALISLIFAEIGDIFHDITSPAEQWLSSHVFGGGEVGFSMFLNNGGILGFIAGFGFVSALAMSQFNVSTFPAALWGLAGGVVLGGVMGLFWYILKRSEGTAGYSMEQLVGQKAVVTERIYQGGLGKISCKVNNMQSWHVARAEDGNEILTGVPVKITRVAGSIVYVLPD